MPKASLWEKQGRAKIDFLWLQDEIILHNQYVKEQNPYPKFTQIYEFDEENLP